MSQSFDATKFSDEEPLTFDTVPWPILKHPASLSVEDVDWSAVENFFQGVQPHMKSQEFLDLVEKSHRRFHPDRWRAKRPVEDKWQMKTNEDFWKLRLIR
ncbi:hypothetical protein MPER_03393 [Moniliophthora perniciosa FA553]|nr:hypothetical protein MPER_03393 [Moniliophthora perniciosa FA553]